MSVEFQAVTSDFKQVTTQPPKVSGYAWYALSAMVVVYTLSFIDRQILSILAEKIKADLQLDDAQLGFLYGTAFAIFYNLFGIPLGRLADNWYRGRLMALGLVVWSVMTALSGFATSYAHLALARIGVGVGEASASPAAFSMLASYFPKERRAFAMAIYTSGVYLGMGLSLPIGGWISEYWDKTYPTGSPMGLAGWQAAFLSVGIPGLLVAFWVLSLREPPRLAASGGHAPIVNPNAWKMFVKDIGSIVPPFTFWSVAKIPGGLAVNLGMALGILITTTVLIWATADTVQWASYGLGVYALGSWIQALRSSDLPTFRLIWGTPTVVFAVVGFGGLALMTYCYGFWVAPYALRTFKLDAGYVGAVIGLPGTAAAAIGVVAGGRLSDWWKARNPRGRIYVTMLAAVLPIPLILVMFTTSNFLIYSLISPLVYMTANLWAGSTVAAYQDFVLPRMYGTVGATYLVGSTMVGLALGPYGSGKVAAVTGSLQIGMLSVLCVTPVTIFFLWLVSRGAEQAETTKVERARAAGEEI